MTTVNKWILIRTRIKENYKANSMSQESFLQSLNSTFPKSINKYHIGINDNYNDDYDDQLILQH